METFTRHPGVCEQFFIARKKANLYTNFFISAKLNQDLNISILFHSLRKVLLNNSFLVLYYSSLDNQLKPCNKVYFNDVVSFQIYNQPQSSYPISSSIDENLLSSLDNYKFQLDNSSKPLWKIIILNNNEIVILCEHLIDGFSCVLFHNLLINEFNNYNYNETNTSEINNNTNDLLLFDSFNDLKSLKPLPPTIDGFLNLDPISLPNAQNNFLSSPLPLFSKSNQIYSSYFCHHNYNSIFKIVKFKKSETEKLLKLKKHFSSNKNTNLRLISIIQIFFLKSLPTNYIKSVYPKQIEFLIAVDLRRFVDNETMENQNLIGSFPSVHKFIIQTDQFLNSTHEFLILKINQEINSILTRPLLLFSNYQKNYINSNGNIQIYKNLLLSQINLKKREVNRLSNLGYNTQSHEGNWKIIEFMFNQNISDIGSSMVLNQISTENGMNFVLGFVKGIFVEYDKNTTQNEDDIINTIASKFKKSLLKF
ncbi:uncharacterized protein ASCRUDRAFT_155159 [Ascoidea rubescens DSM 1968]|uniref:Alcohol acetyltransferase n=1 Tax=Ascoidea rubescens DSM 1968 TaxID=1344418 RepID=A0A1D2VG06_9ASCO|nr:hypothetical protein ASCRUDRAFT_155159 [Ascoidea rubescens DSM 1968]ODV60566.1 hypothetical protein ASCRUDRAFT_155159 [Ascoidea rubescens DSM 1968]